MAKTRDLLNWVLHWLSAGAEPTRRVSVDLTSDVARSFVVICDMDRTTDFTHDIARSFTLVFDVDRTPDFTHDVARSFTVTTDRKNA